MAAPSVTSGPAAKQVRGAPDYAASLLVPARVSEGVEAAFNAAGLFIGHIIPPDGGMVSYYPVPLPAVRAGLVLAAEVCADGEVEGDASCALHWRWLAKGAVAREVYTQPLDVARLITHRIPLDMEHVDRADLSFTAALVVTPLSGVPILMRSAWLEMRE